MTILPIDRHTVSAYNKEENRLVIVAVNSKSRERKLSLDLEEFSPEIPCQAIRTSGSLEEGEHWAELTAPVLKGAVLEADLKPYSITTFILSTRN